MQAASAVQVTVQRFGIWNAALGLVSATALSAAVAWLVTRSDELPGWSGMLLMASVLVGVLGAVDLLRRRPITLRWDTQRWHVTDPSRGAGDIEVTSLAVALDLGSWMLLSFRGDAPRRTLRLGWIPVQRSGIEAQWHALRCAVYAQGPRWIQPHPADGRGHRG